jgi:Holliday junction resolvase
MSRKSKGINAERELIHLFWKNGWAAIRIAGSGSMRYPSPDIIASNKRRRLAIECKATKSKYQYLSEEDVQQIKDFSAIFGAEPWFGVRFNNENWMFLPTENLNKTGKNYVISCEDAKIKGVSFEELTRANLSNP